MLGFVSTMPGTLALGIEDAIAEEPPIGAADAEPEARLHQVLRARTFPSRIMQQMVERHAVSENVFETKSLVWLAELADDWVKAGLRPRHP